MTKSRHVVFIVLDTARADVFEPWGAEPGASPELMGLARQGWAAPNAIATSSWTLPSHVAMLLGIPHRQAGLVKSMQSGPLEARPVLDANRARYLPKVLHDHGYWTVGASANPWLQSASGFAEGFDEFDTIWPTPPSPRRGLKQLGAAGRYCSIALGRYDDELKRATAIADRWIDHAARDGRPSFLFLNLMECHAPCLPPSPFDGLGPRGRLQAWCDAQTYLEMVAVWRANLARELPPTEVLDRMRSLYLRAVKYVDAWLGELVRKLQRAGAFDDTLILITSDHGENLGEGARIGHAFSLDQRLIQVPLVAVNAACEAPDLMFTLSDLPALIASEVGLDSHPWQHSANQHIVVSRVEGVGEADDPRITRFLTESGLDAKIGEMTQDRACALDGRYKLVRTGATETLFDLTADPLEAEGWSGSEVPIELAERVTALSAEIDAALALDAEPPRTESVASGGGDRTDVERLEEQMRLLGYI